MGVNTSNRIDVYFTEYFLATQKLMKKDTRTGTLFLRRKDKKCSNKNLVVNLLELIQVSVMMKIMKLVECKHLSANLKTNN